MKKRPLQLQILLTKGYAETGDKAKDDCLRIDQMSYYLSSLFWFMNTAVKGYELLDIETEHKLFEFRTFRGHVEALSEIGIGLAEQLTVYSIAATNNETRKEADNKPLSSAEMISRLIKDASLPLTVSDALTDAVVDLINKHGSEREFSPEFIAQLIESEKTSEVKNV